MNVRKAGPRPIAPLGPPASVRFQVLQRTEPLLRPAPSDDLTRGSVPMMDRSKIPQGSADAVVPIMMA
jgi:hypothetical protein